MVKGITEILHESGLKVTKTRVAVLEYMIKSKSHPSVDMIREYLDERNIHVPVSTLYNILDTFVEKGIICKVMEDENGMMRYDARLEAHMHVYDGRDNTIRDIEENDLTEKIIALMQELKKKEGISDDSRLIMEV